MNIPEPIIAILTTLHPMDGWHWAHSGRCSLALRELGQGDDTDDRHISIHPREEGECTLTFVVSPKWSEGFYPGIIFQNMQEAKSCVDNLLASPTPPIPPAPTPLDEVEIPRDIRAQLKQFAPPCGPYVPDEARKAARNYYPPQYDINEETAGWCWDEDDGYCYLDLWSTEETDCCDPVGWVAICPLEQGGYTLEFRLDLEWSEDDDLDPEDLVFQTMEQAKRFLDRALACNTPPLSPQPSHWED